MLDFMNVGKTEKAHTRRPCLRMSFTVLGESFHVFVALSESSKMRHSCLTSKSEPVERHFACILCVKQMARLFLVVRADFLRNPVFNYTIFEQIMLIHIKRNQAYPKPHKRQHIHQPSIGTAKLSI